MSLCNVINTWNFSLANVEDHQLKTKNVNRRGVLRQKSPLNVVTGISRNYDSHGNNNTPLIISMIGWMKKNNRPPRAARIDEHFLVLSTGKSRFRSQNPELRTRNRAQNPKRDLATDFVKSPSERQVSRVMSRDCNYLTEISINKIHPEIPFRIPRPTGNPNIRTPRPKSGFHNPKHPLCRCLWNENVKNRWLLGFDENTNPQ